MHKYTVAADENEIYAGIMNPTNEDGTKTWKRKMLCTDEALEAVKDFLLYKAKEADSNTVFTFWKDNGKIIKLSLEVMDESDQEWTDLVDD